jgi:hypothetical protein
MKNPTITLANDSYGKTPVGRVGFVKGFGVIAKVRTPKNAIWSQSRGFWYIYQIGCVSRNLSSFLLHLIKIYSHGIFKN